MTASKKIDELYDLIKGIEIAMFTTRGITGQLVSRPMATQDRIEGADLWFVTDSETHKLADLEIDPHVNCSYYNSRSREWVSVSGIARVTKNRAKIRQLYKEDWKAWFGDAGRRSRWRAQRSAARADPGRGRARYLYEGQQAKAGRPVPGPEGDGDWIQGRHRRGQGDLRGRNDGLGRAFCQIVTTPLEIGGRFAHIGARPPPHAPIQWLRQPPPPTPKALHSPVPPRHGYPQTRLPLLPGPSSAKRRPSTTCTPRSAPRSSRSPASRCRCNTRPE